MVYISLLNKKGISLILTHSLFYSIATSTRRGVARGGGTYVPGRKGTGVPKYDVNVIQNMITYGGGANF